jgi:hypothetical protein
MCRTPGRNGSSARSAIDDPDGGKGDAGVNAGKKK